MGDYRLFDFIMLIKRTCQQCGVSFLGGPRAWYCPSCRIERTRETNARYKQRKRQGKTRRIGSIDLCSVCGKEYTVSGGLQKYCPDCAPEAIRAVDREQSRAYYQRVKAVLNPIRNDRRRKPPRTCLVCGASIPPTKKFCSEVCRKAHVQAVARRRSRSYRLERSQRPDAVAFRKALKAARAKAGLSQRELGIRCGFRASIAQNKVSFWEAGLRVPSAATRKVIADALGCDISELE